MNGLVEEKQPLISIDVVPIRFHKEQRKLQWATGKRIFEPFLGEDALPGVLLKTGESIEEAATRALGTKTGLPKGYLSQLGSFDGTNRDPRGATISIALISVQPFTVESSKALWHEGTLALPFDHQTIVEEAFRRLAANLWTDVPFTRALLGEKFSTSEALALPTSVNFQKNAQRWLRNWGELSEIGTVKTSGAGRPSTLWAWK